MTRPDIIARGNGFHCRRTRFFSCLGSEDPRHSDALSYSKNPCGNSGTSEPAANPVVSHFPRPLDFGGHNSEKCGTGPELLDDHPWERM